MVKNATTRTTPSAELIEWRAARAEAAAAFECYDDDRLDLMCEARAVAVRLSGRRDLDRVPMKVPGEMVSMSEIEGLAAGWRRAVPEDRRAELDAAWSTTGRGLAALTHTLHELRSRADKLARGVPDVLDEAEGQRVETWRLIAARTCNGSSDARAACTYQVDDLLVLGYDAAVVSRYRVERRSSSKSFEVWARCTEEGAVLCRHQRPKTEARLPWQRSALWHQVLVPMVDVRDDEEPRQIALQLAVDKCLAMRAREVERWSAAPRVP